MEDKSKNPGNNSGETKPASPQPETTPNLSYVPDFEWTPPPPPPPPPPTVSGSINEGEIGAATE